MESTMTTLYRSTVTEIGSQVELFLTERMIVIFNESAPADLKDIAIVHKQSELLHPIQAGDRLIIDGHSFNILYVGSKANETIHELGHCTIAFTGQVTADLPGTICVEEKQIPAFKVGSEIVFQKA